MTPLVQFMPRIEPLLLAAPRPLLEQALVDCAIDFCERTLVVQRVLDPVPTQVGVAEYELDLEQDTTLASVLNVWYGPRLLRNVVQQAQERVQAYPAHADQTLGTPVQAHVLDPAAVRIFPAPQTDPQPLVLRVAVRPQRRARSLPDELFEDWAEAMVYGTIARVAVIPGQAFTNADLAAAAGASYAHWLTEARPQASTGRIRGNLRVRALPFV